MFGLNALSLGLGSFKWIAVGLVALAIVSTIGFSIRGFYKYHEKELAVLYEKNAGLEKTINAQKEQIAGLIIDNSNLKLSNNTLQDQYNVSVENLKRAIQEVNEINKIDAGSQERINALEKTIADQVRNDRIRAARNGEKSELFLNFINKNVECWIANFERVGGRCVRGSWVQGRQ